jgi:hypothetical protein
MCRLSNVLFTSVIALELLFPVVTLAEVGRNREDCNVHDCQNHDESKSQIQLVRAEADGQIATDSTSSQSEKLDRPGIFFPQLVSFFLPGFDQYWEGEYAAGATYSGVALGGILAGDFFYKRARDRLGDKFEHEDSGDIETKDRDVRPMQLGDQLLQAAGGMSAYHSFRSAAMRRKPYGDFAFLKTQDSPIDVLVAPFQFQYLTRPTTYLPIGIALALVAFESKNSEQVKLTGSDIAYSGMFSYNAGVHEEAVFRGWLLPVAREATGSDLGSNLLESAAFAAVHLTTVSVPWPQFILGMHLGYVTQRNGWSISESAFIHTWWDIITFLGVYSSEAEAIVKGPGPTLHLPPISIVF